MLAPSPTPTEQPARLVTEAEALCYLLGDLGLIPAVNLSNDTIYATLSGDVKAGALDVLAVITKRAIDEDDFREEMISAIALSGFYLADSPSYNSDLKTASAEEVGHALLQAGVMVDFHDLGGLRFAPHTSGFPANAHLLMNLAVKRVADDDAFAEDLRNSASRLRNRRG